MKKALLFFMLALPFFYLLYEVLYIKELNDPIKYIYTFTGASSLVLLLLTTLISSVKEWVNLIKYRKIVGLFGFFYALLHLLNFVVLDASLDMVFVFEESLDKPFIYLGMVAFFILLFMAVTSTKGLFRRFNKYHKFLYLAITLATIHFIMAQKALSISQWFYVLIILVIAYVKIRQRYIKV